MGSCQDLCSRMFLITLPGVTSRFALDYPPFPTHRVHTGGRRPSFVSVANGQSTGPSPYLPSVGSVGGHRTPGQRRVTREVYAALMARKIVNHSQISRATGLSPKTVRTFFSGTRWPNAETLLKFEEVLKWEPGTIQTQSEIYDETAAADIEPRNPTERAILASNMSELDKLRTVLMLRREPLPRVAESGE